MYDKLNIEEIQRGRIALLEQALRLVCSNILWSVAQPLSLWHLGRPATAEEVYDYYLEQAKLEAGYPPKDRANVEPQEMEAGYETKGER
jgi:hypothetical protein